MSRLISAFVALVTALTVFSSVVFVVDQRQCAVVFAFGEIERVIKEPGLHFKLPPPLQNVVFMDKRLQTIDVAGTDRFTAAERKNLLVDWFVKWRVSDPRLFYVNFKGDSRLAQDSMTQKINSIARDEFTRRTVFDAVLTDREAAMQSILRGVQEHGKSVGMDIIDVCLKRVDLLASVTESVYRRMEAEHKRVANELCSTGTAEGEKIRADADRQHEVVLVDAYRDAQKIKGEDGARTADIYVEAFDRSPQFAAFWRSMEAYRASFRDWKDVPVLQSNNDFFKYMRNPNGGNSVAAPAAQTGRHRQYNASLII